ncbi:hypothetical protein [Pelagibacterium mangrovi]|uniref:hypothetical protein n=1 Tax=Pelagibacterium mangrovi TaxID=3119828 RepID=UPI002FC9DFDC
MANRQRGAVEIEAFDRTLTLRFSFNAMCEIEEHFDKSFDEVMSSLNTKHPRLTTLRGVLWGAMCENQPRPSLSNIGELVDELGAEAIGAAISKAMEAAFPKSDASENPPKASKAGTGKTS